MADVDAVDLALAESLEAVAAAMRKGEVLGLYVVWMNGAEQIGILHTGEAAVEMAEASLAMDTELVMVGGLN